MTESDALKEAKERMEAGRKAREKRRKQVKHVDEPEHLVSGGFDEVGLKREEKHGDDDE